MSDENPDQLRVPPRNIEAEEGLLACCLLPDGGSGVVTELIGMKITPEYFFKTAHGEIFKALTELVKAEEPVDEIVLYDYIQRHGIEEETGGLAQIYHIQGRIDTAAHTKYYAKIVSENYLLRRLIRVSREITENAYKRAEDPFVLAGKSEDLFRKISESEQIGSEGVKSAEEVGRVEVAKMLARMKNPELLHENVVRTHLRDLNGMFDFEGFSPGEMIVLAARPSVGKSSLAANFADFASVDGQNGVLYFNLEMLSGQTFNRIVAGRSRIRAKDIRRGEVRPADQKFLKDAIDQVMAAPLYLDDRSSNTIMDIRNEALKKARELRRKGKRLNLIVIDYLQLVRPIDPKMPRIQQVGEISRGVKALAKELEVPVLILSQLNRESAKTGGKPTMAQLREAGDIEQDADVIILMHRMSDTENEADESINPDIDHIKLLIEKQRDGAVGEVDTTFIKKYTRFENFAR